MDSPSTILSSAEAHRSNRQAGLSRLIAIDVRNLALLRVGLAIIILVDLAQRCSSVSVFLSDGGVLPRAINQWLCAPSAGFWSLYWLSGSPVFATGLLALNAAAAVALLIGWNTRWATFACLILAYSLQMRMPLILTAGHVLLRLLLFWSLFLPMGAVWSLDSWRLEKRRPRSIAHQSAVVISIATAAIMLQVAMMYLFSGIAKWNEVWLRGDALAMALQLDMYVRPLGRSLLAVPQLLMLGTYLILLLEIIGPLLLWMPPGNPRWRVGLMVMFWAMHAGIWLTMSIGIFSAVAMWAWVIFLPPEIWTPRRAKSAMPLASAALVAAGRPSIRRLGLFPSIVCGIFLLYVVALNVANRDVDKTRSWFGPALRAVGHSTMTLQQFKMFDRPSSENFWWRLIGRDEGGEPYDWIFHEPQPSAGTSGKPLPESIYASIPDQFWRRLLYNLATIEIRSNDDQDKLRQLRLRAGYALRDIRDPARVTGPMLWLCAREKIFAVAADAEPEIVTEPWGLVDDGPAPSK